MQRSCGWRCHENADPTDGILTTLTFRFVDALIDANKDFDLVVVPGGRHTFHRRGMFFQRKMWDFCVRHLLDVEPPDWNAIEVGAGR